MTLKREFGRYIRKKRLALRSKDASFSLRRVAGRMGVEPSFLSKVERGLAPPPSEEKIILLAEALGEDADLLLALAGRISTDVKEVIRRRAPLIAELVRELGNVSDEAIVRMVHEARQSYGRKRKRQ